MNLHILYVSLQAELFPPESWLLPSVTLQYRTFPIYVSEVFQLCSPWRITWAILVAILYLYSVLGMILSRILKRSCFSSLIILHTNASGVCAITAQRPAGSSLVFETVALLQIGQLKVWHPFWDTWSFECLGYWQSIYQHSPPEMSFNHCTLQTSFFRLSQNKTLTPDKFTQNSAFQFLLCHDGWILMSVTLVCHSLIDFFYNN